MKQPTVYKEYFLNSDSFTSGKVWEILRCASLSKCFYGTENNSNASSDLLLDLLDRPGDNL